MIQAQLKVAPSLVPHCVFTGNTVCAGCWSQAQAAHACRALAAGGPCARFTSGMLQLATCCVTVTLIPPGKKNVEEVRQDLHSTRLWKYGCRTNLDSRWLIVPNRAKWQTQRYSEFANSQTSRNPWWSLEKQFPVMCQETAAVSGLSRKPCMFEHPVPLPLRLAVIYKSALEREPHQVWFFPTCAQTKQQQVFDLYTCWLWVSIWAIPSPCLHFSRFIKAHPEANKPLALKAT